MFRLGKDVQDDQPHARTAGDPTINCDCQPLYPRPPESLVDPTSVDSVASPRRTARAGTAVGPARLSDAIELDGCDAHCLWRRSLWSWIAQV